MVPSSVSIGRHDSGASVKVKRMVSVENIVLGFFMYLAITNVTQWVNVFGGSGFCCNGTIL